jgi:adenosine deaminase
MQKLSTQHIRALPKVELHRHLDCSVRWSTLIELAPQVGITLATTYAAQREQFLVESPMRDLGSVLKKFLNTQKVLASEEILTRVAYEACEDAFNDGIRVLELRYAPTFIADGHHTLTFEKIHRALHAGIEMAKKKLPMAVGLICIVQRIKPFAVAETVVDFVIDYKDTFIALDLADNEEGSDPKVFAPLFEKAKKAGLHITVHSGETPMDDAALWVRDSIEILGAERIGHGIQIVRNPSVLNFVRDRGVPLEVCPISNYLTQAFATHAEHPVRKLMNSGIKVTINSDDPGVFATTLSDDYEVLQNVHGFTVAEFNQCNRHALDSSFLEKKDLEIYRNLFL